MKLRLLQWKRIGIWAGQEDSLDLGLLVTKCFIQVWVPREAATTIKGPQSCLTYLYIMSAHHVKLALSDVYSGLCWWQVTNDSKMHILLHLDSDWIYIYVFLLGCLTSLYPFSLLIHLSVHMFLYICYVSICSPNYLIVYLSRIWSFLSITKLTGRMCPIDSFLSPRWYIELLEPDSQL